VKFNSIQVLRAWAVLSVVILHSQSIAPGLVEIPFFSDFGWIGVCLFFVISGFVIAERIAFETSLKEFILRRYLRVVPLYALATLIAFAISVAMDAAIFTAARTEDGTAFAIDDLGTYLVASLLILPQDRWPFFMVGWSLEYEVVFYVTFGCTFFFLKRKGALAVMLALTALGSLELPFVRTLFDSFFVYFLIGCLAREVTHLRLRHQGPLAASIAMTTASLAILHLYQVLDLTNLGFVTAGALCFGSMIVGIVELEKRTGLFSGRTMLVLIGDISYSIYLVHWLLFPLVKSWVANLQLTSLEFEILRALSILTALVLSWLVWRFIERPLNRACRRAISTGSLHANYQERPSPIK
jgi:peptidoglycan/LPS O-acetylase OafA/YrhL